MERNKIRPLIAMLALAVTVSAQAAPILSGAGSCSMPRSSAVPPCPRCAAPSASVSVPSIAARSCCRFGAPETVTRAPGVVPSPRVPETSAALLALPCPGLERGSVLASRPDAVPPRSTDSPNSLHSPLRL